MSTQPPHPPTPASPRSEATLEVKLSSYCLLPPTPALWLLAELLHFYVAKSIHLFLLLLRGLCFVDKGLLHPSVTKISSYVFS